MRQVVLAAAFLAFTIAAKLAHADDPCAAFTWDVRHERSLFSQRPQSLAAGQTLPTAPAIVIERLYQLELQAQTEVAFPAIPGKPPKSAGAYAGLVKLTVDAPGVYRISLDQPVWVDVVQNGTTIAADGFQGRKGCSAPHKIVEFLLPAGIPLTLQFSGSNAAVVKTTVTRSPRATS